MSNNEKPWYGHIKNHGKYRSRFEADIAQQLEEAGVEFAHEADRIKYRHSQGDKVYIPDFTIYCPDCRKFFIEAKGWIDGAANSKMQAVKNCNLGIDLRFVFQSATTKVARLKSNVCQWARRHRFQYAVKTVPPEWLALAVSRG